MINICLRRIRGYQGGCAPRESGMPLFCNCKCSACHIWHAYEQEPELKKRIDPWRMGAFFELLNTSFSHTFSWLSYWLWFDCCLTNYGGNIIYSQNSGNWYVLHVRAKCEKKVADLCSKHHLNCYLPLSLEKKIYQRRKVEVWKPLFPNYLFAQFRPEQRIIILQSIKIVRILEVKDRDKFINEIEQVRKALEVNPALYACPAITVGTMVKIISGSFQGLEGIVVQTNKCTRVVLNVQMIGQGVSIEIDRNIIRIV